MPDRLRRPTMNDVARTAGVSLKSVSRVVNDEVGASQETRERVLAAAQALGYRRNDAARALRRSDGRSASIGLVLEDIGNPFASALNRAVEQVASAQGSLVLAVSTNADPDREELSLPPSAPIGRQGTRGARSPWLRSVLVFSPGTKVLR